MESRRSELGLSQAAAASRAGVARTTWSSWENSPEFPRLENWNTIAEALEIPVENLMRLASLNWFTQVGLTAEQLASLKVDGIQLDGPGLDYQFESMILEQLNQELDVDIDLTTVRGRQLAWLRGHLRRMLIQQDSFLKTLREVVYTFNEMYTENLVKTKKYQVQKKGEVVEDAAKSKTKKRKKTKVTS